MFDYQKKINEKVMDYENKDIGNIKEEKKSETDSEIKKENKGKEKKVSNFQE